MIIGTVLKSNKGIKSIECKPKFIFRFVQATDLFAADVLAWDVGQCLNDHVREIFGFEQNLSYQDS